MSIELAVGGSLFIIGLWVAITALFPDGRQVRMLTGAGGLLYRGVRGIFADPSMPASGEPPVAARGGHTSVPEAQPLQGPATVHSSTTPWAPSQEWVPTLALQETLTAIEDVLSRLLAQLSSGTGDAAGRQAPIEPSEVGVPVSVVLRESMPAAFNGVDVEPSSPMLHRLFELCEEGLTASNHGATHLDRTPAPSAPDQHPDQPDVLAKASAVANYTDANYTDEGSAMTEPSEPSRFSTSHDGSEISADVEAEMFEAAMTALAHALVDDDDAVRAASIRALRAIDRERVRNWATATLLSAVPDDVAAAARIVSTLGLHDVAGDVLEKVSPEGGPERDAAVAALRALAPTSEEASRMVHRLEEPQRAAVVMLVPELLEGPALTDTLHVLTGDRSEQVRLAAVEAIGRHADRDTVVRVASRTIGIDPSPAVRAAAAHLLGQVGAGSGGPWPSPGDEPGGSAVETWTTRLQTAGAVHTPAVDDPVAVPESLVEHPRQGDAGVPLEAAEHLADVLMDVALRYADDPDPTARALAVRAALTAATEEGVMIAVLALGDPDPQVRRAAVEVCRRDAADSASALRRLITDPDREVRAAAVEILAASEDDEATASLVVALADPDENIRSAARSALRDRASPALARLLVRELEAEGSRNAAAALLLAMGDVGRRAVEDALPSMSGEAVLAASPLLAADGATIGRYLAELRSLDPRIRLKAVRALGAIGGGPEVTDALVARLQDPVEDIRVEVVTHLGRTGAADAEPLLRRIRDADPAPAVAAAADRALGERWPVGGAG